MSSLETASFDDAVKGFRFPAIIESLQQVALPGSRDLVRRIVWFLAFFFACRFIFNHILFAPGTHLPVPVCDECWQQHPRAAVHITCPRCDEPHQPGEGHIACQVCDTVHKRTVGHTVCIGCEHPHPRNVHCESDLQAVSLRKSREKEEQVRRLRQTIADKQNQIDDLVAEVSGQMHVIEGITISADTASTRRLQYDLLHAAKQFREKEKVLEDLKRDCDMEILHVNELFKKMQRENPALARRYSKPTHAGCIIKLDDEERVDSGFTDATTPRESQGASISASEWLTRLETELKRAIRSPPPGTQINLNDALQRLGKIHEEARKRILFSVGTNNNSIDATEAGQISAKEKVSNWLNMIASKLETVPTLPAIGERIIELIDNYKTLRSRQASSEIPISTPTMPRNTLLFQEYDDMSLRKEFGLLHLAVKRLAFRTRNYFEFTEQTRLLSEMTVLIQGATSQHFAKHTQYLLEGVIWSFLLKAVFANPLVMFGPRAAYLVGEWTSPNAHACAELWRWSTAQALLRSAGLGRDQMTGPSATSALYYVVKDKLALNKRFPADAIEYTEKIGEADPNGRRSIIDAQSTLLKALQRLVKTMGVDLGKADREIEEVTVKAQVLAIKLASQLPRIELVHQPAGTIVDDSTTWGDHPLHEKIPVCQPIQIGRLVFTSRPGLRKWGDENGDGFHESVDLVPSQVCIDEAEDLIRNTYEPRPKMPPRHAQPQVPSGVSQPRVFKTNKKMAGRHHQTVPPKDNAGEPSANSPAAGMPEPVDTDMEETPPQNVPDTGAGAAAEQGNYKATDESDDEL